MKVVHINTYQTGGAALCAIRIHNALLKNGIDSKMIFAQGQKSDRFDIATPQSYNWSNNWLVRKIQVFACKLHLWPKYEYLSYQLEKRKKRERQTFFTLPVSLYTNLHDHQWVKEADIVHLHWVANFVDFPSFFKFINKPVVWTLHDENPGLGGFHYSLARNNAPIGLYDSLEKICLDIKLKVYLDCKKLYLVAISRVMKDFVINNNLLKSVPVTEIYNGIDEDDFSLKIRKQSRIELSLSNDGRKIIMFSSYNIWEERKGLRELIKAIERISFEKKPMLICLGNYIDLPYSDKIDFICPGLINDKDLLSKYYSASDLFVMPSFQESFGQTPVESLCCGTPVVAFPSGIIPELITDVNGFICKDYTIESLVYGISSALIRKYDPSLIREDVVKKFSYNIVSQQYMDLYKKFVK